VLGRTTQSWTYTTATPTGTASNATITSYTYTPSNQPATMTDTAGNAWTWTYDLHGNQIKAVDPGTGTTTSTYDAAGNLLSSTDARGTTLSYSYDPLNRKTAEYNTTGGAGKTAADEQAAWTYDTLLKGLPTSSIRYTNGSADTTHTYTESITGYTALSQPTGESVTIPSAEGSLAGTYSDSQTYTSETSLLDGTHYNPEGSLPKEQVNYGYSLSGILTGFGGTQVYLNTSTYNPYGQILQTNFGVYGEQLDQNETYDVDTGRPLTTTDSLQTSTTGPIDDTSYTYNQAGNITSESNLQAGDTTPDTQCFSYDNQNRLTAAYTDTGTINTTTGSKTAQIFGIGGCADTTATAGKITGGPAPYAQTYTYDALGDRVGEKQLNTATAAASTTETLTYNGYNASTGVNTAAATPDAVQSVTTATAAGTATATYGYTDGNGDTNTRTVATSGTITASPSQKIAYDPEGRTQSVTDTAAGTVSSYLYDASGNLLLQHDQASNQTTLYLPFGEEITLNTGSGTITGNRYITASPDGITIVHASSGVISYELSDRLHTATTEVAASNLAVTNRYFDPYGNPRGTVPTSWPDQHSFLGQPQDRTTGLDLLGARQYDPTTGRFLSVDPVLEVGDQRQMNGYAYSADDPVNGSDPTGMLFDGGGCTGSDCVVTGSGGGGGHAGGSGGGSGGGATGTSCDSACQQAAQLAVLEAKRKADEQKQVTLKAEEAALAARQQYLEDHSMGCVESRYTGYCPDLSDISLVSMLTFFGAIGVTVLLGPAMLTAIGAECSITWVLCAAAISTTAVRVGVSLMPGNLDGGDPAGSIGGEANAAGSMLSQTENAEAQVGEDLKTTQAQIAADECANSFTGNTLVEMADGTTKPIDKVKVGDEIRNAEPGAAPGSKDQTHAVTALHITHTDHDYTDVTVAGTAALLTTATLAPALLGADYTLGAGGGTITGTAHHLYYDATTQQWTEADELRIGDLLQTTDGRTVAITALRDYPATTVTYNLTIDTLHTYYVVAGDTPVLVHNSNGIACGPVPGEAHEILDEIDKSGTTPQGVRGPTEEFLNDGRNGSALLPTVDADGNPITYREWCGSSNMGGDPAAVRDRIVTGSDGSAYYSPDHYKTFYFMR